MPLGSSEDRAGWWDQSKFYALAKERSKTPWPCSKQRQMGQASPLLMDQIVQGQMMAREGCNCFVMAQEAEKTLHGVRPKNCRVLKQGKAENFLPFVLMCFTEESTNSCVCSPELAEISEMKQSLLHQDCGYLTPQKGANTALYPLNP